MLEHAIKPGRDIPVETPSHFFPYSLRILFFFLAFLSPRERERALPSWRAGYRSFSLTPFILQPLRESCFHKSRLLFIMFLPKRQTFALDSFDYRLSFTFTPRGTRNLKCPCLSVQINFDEILTLRTLWNLREEKKNSRESFLV